MNDRKGARVREMDGGRQVRRKDRIKEGVDRRKVGK